jgi:hypothetical protein
MPPHVLVAPDRGPLEKPVVFLAGGITNSPRWQDVAVAHFQGACPAATVCNPRRPRDFEDDAVEYHKQVTWELDHLEAADLALFWFPAAECRITRIELGLMLGAGKAVVVGTDPAFVNRRYLEVLCRRKGLPLHDRLEDALDAAARWLKAWRAIPLTPSPSPPF